MQDMLFMTMRLVELGLLLASAVATLLIAGLPAPVRQRLWANCRTGSGRWSWSRATRELAAVLRLAGAVGVLVFCLTLLGGGIVGIVHQQIVPLPLVIEVFERFHPNVAVWEDRLEHGSAGDFGAHPEDWFVERGGTTAAAQRWQTLLWFGWPLALAACLLLAAWTVRLLVRVYTIGVTELERQACRRAP